MPKHRNNPITALELLKNDLHLSRQEVAVLRAKLNNVEAHCAESDQAFKDACRERDVALAEAASKNSMMNRVRDNSDARISELKRIIADLEKKLAESHGYARALNERLEHDSPLVEVPQVTRRADLARRPNRDIGLMGTERPRSFSEGSKHWTAI